MNLFFLRHAKAEPRSDKYKPDAKRPLTRLGEEITTQVAKGMVRLDLGFDLIITSPYVRAVRTAELTAGVLKTDKVWASETLGSDGDPKKLIAVINENYGSLENILLVGHEPYMSKLMSVLLIGDSDLQINFKKSGLANLSIEDLRYGKCATLEWLLTPRQLQRLGKK